MPGREGRALDAIRHPAAETAAACGASGRVERYGIGRHGQAEVGWPGVEAREPAGDLEPRRLRAGEEMRDRTRAGIVVQRAGGNPDASLPRRRLRIGDHRAAAVAEWPMGAGARLVAHDAPVAPFEPPRTGGTHDERREGG